MKTATATNQHGEAVIATVGKAIWFKADVEQSAIVKELRYAGWDGRQLQVRVDVTQGEYAGRDQWFDLNECWN